MDLYRIDKLDLATYLRLCGFEIIGWKALDTPGKVLMEFEKSDELLEAVRKFQNRQAVVEITGYFDMFYELRRAARAISEGRNF